MLRYLTKLLRHPTVAPPPPPAVTWDAALAEYFASGDFLRLAPASQRAYRPVLVRWLRDAKLGPLPVGALTALQLEASLTAGGLRQGAANFRLKRARVLIRFAKRKGHRADDPSLDVKCPPIGKHHHTWSDGEVRQYREHWQLGTRQRLAFELALCTSQRRTDLAGMRWEHIQEGRVAVTQSKTGVELLVPVHPGVASGAATGCPRGSARARCSAALPDRRAAP